jgi:hemolysin III
VRSGSAAWNQSRPLREEVASSVIQGGAAVASVVGLVYLLLRAGAAHDGVARAAVALYGASMFTAFVASALYHGVRQPRLKGALQQVDHCTIFLLIAGTYTPVALLPLRHHAGVVLLAAVWSQAIAGITLRMASRPAFERIAIPLYLLMGWCGLAWCVPLHREIGTGPILLMLAGALTYTGGLLFYRWHARPFSNPLWHLCVVAGSAWFFVAIAGFLPG